jgi:integration host factor subunit alpha
MSNEKSKHCLTKADLAEAIYSALPVDKQKAALVVEDYVEIIKDALANEGKVMLSGFGSYRVKYKPARRGRNPQTGDSITLRSRKVVKFQPSQLLRKAINSGKILPGTDPSQISEKQWEEDDESEFEDPKD